MFKILTDPFNTLSTIDKATRVSFYFTLALAVVIVALFILVKKFKREAVNDFNKTVGGIIVGYSIGLVGILLTLTLDKYFTRGDVELATFIPVVCLLCSVIILAICGLVINFFKKDSFKLFTKIALGIIGAFLLAIVISFIVVDNYSKVSPETSGGKAMLYIFTIILAAALVALALVFGKKKSVQNETKSITYAAVCMALSFALSYIRFWELPQGGSITLASLVPLMLYSYMFGIKKGLITGVIYGFLQFIQSPWFYHPMQFLLDYPIAFGAIGLAGLFHELKIFENKKVLQFILGAVVAVILRYLSHVVSGIFVFGSGEPENYSAVAWSFLYNSFAFADMAICIVVGSALFASKSFTAFLDRSAE